MTRDCWGELAFFSELRDLIANKQNISPPPSLTFQQQDYIVSDGRYDGRYRFNLNLAKYRGVFWKKTSLKVMETARLGQKELFTYFANNYQNPFHEKIDTITKQDTRWSLCKTQPEW